MLDFFLSFSLFFPFGITGLWRRGGCLHLLSPLIKRQPLLARFVMIRTSVIVKL